jgi:peroxiredoxin
LNKKQFILVSMTIIMFSLGWLLLTPILFPGTQAETALTAPHPGFNAPDFTLQTPLGETYTLSNFHGSPVMVLFWASWCSICRSTMPGFDVIYQEFAPQGFNLLAINTQDVTSTGINHFQSQGYTYTLLLDEDNAISNTYRVHALPTSVLINSQGIITDVVIGSGMSAPFLRARLADLLTEGPQ